MGLNKESTGQINLNDSINISKDTDIVVALTGNPNVGKSTVFNALTGMNQHTGNWPGKTVATAVGYCNKYNKKIAFVDLPGCYSLLAHSPEEEIASEYICNAYADITVIVCDATCLERNLILTYQTLEATNNAILCVNLIDEAEKKGIKINFKKLEEELGIPIVPMCARNKKGTDKLLKTIIDYNAKKEKNCKTYIEYSKEVENLINEKINFLNSNTTNLSNKRWIAINEIIKENTINNFEDIVASCTVKAAENTAGTVIKFTKQNYSKNDRAIDKIITSKTFGFPLMFIMLSIIFWITITGANYPSEFLSKFFFYLEDKLYNLIKLITSSTLVADMIAHGIFRVLTWVVAVMLPPMAIFFPLFSIMEDLGFLPRIAFNLDKCFKKCDACGKQSLTMCMGFGCNAAGVVGCRIIDSPRERLIAIITNAFVPCNGRFPAMISIISMFLITSSFTFGKAVLSSLLLSIFIVLGIVLTLFASKILSVTLLKGLPSSFALELPPYRRPQITKTIISSLLDRAVFVLIRAASVAAPAGLIIWLFANITIKEANLLTIISEFLEPFGKLLGLDGVILLAFILGFPANEIVVPIIIMTYMSSNTLIDINDLNHLKTLFVDNGWTITTAINTIIFSLCHWPCSTTLLTIRKETKSIKWTIVAFLAPTIIGIVLCFFINLISNLFI